jgi:hypothetical protein
MARWVRRLVSFGALVTAVALFRNRKLNAEEAKFNS